MIERQLVPRGVSARGAFARTLLDQLNHSDARGVRRSYREFAAEANPRFEWSKHCEVIASVLQRVADGELKRVAVFMPPRHGKSEQASRLFPAYVLREFPERWVSIVSYGESLALGFSRAARRNFSAAGTLRGDTKSMKEWETGAGGGLWATGVGGASVGKGFHYGVIDDPVKDSKAAHSAVVARSNVEWYTGTYYTRQQPHAALLLCMTRWALIDLSSYIIEQERSGEQREGWHFVVLPAIYEGPPSWIPDGCTLEPDWREVGEPLWPERFGLDELAKIRENVGEHVWQAQYQQSPVPREGAMVKWEWLPVVDADPVDVRARCRYWDLAGTEGGGDYTASVLMAIDSKGCTWVEHAVRGRWGLARREEEIARIAQEDREFYGASMQTGFERDVGMGGTDRTQALIRRLAGHSCFVSSPTSSKEQRFEPFVAQAEAGNVRLCKGEWNTEYIGALCDFPHGKYDDWVDATSGAYTRLAEKAHRRVGRTSTVGLIGH